MIENLIIYITGGIMFLCLMGIIYAYNKKPNSSDKNPKTTYSEEELDKLRASFRKYIRTGIYDNPNKLKYAESPEESKLIVEQDFKDGNWY